PLRRRCVMSCRQLAALLLVFPLGLGAQTSAKPLAVASGGNAAMPLPARTARRAPVCDGSTMRSAKQRAYFGLAMIGASLPVSLVGMYKTVHSASHPEGPVATGVAVGAALAIGGYFVASTSVPPESFWESAVAR